MSDLDYAGLCQALVENVTQYALFATDPSGRILTWSGGVRSLLGYQREEFIGQSAEILLTCAAAREGVLQTLLGNARREGSSLGTLWLVRSTGELIHADVAVSRINGPDGQLHGFAHVVREISKTPAAAREALGFGTLNSIHTLVRSLDGIVLVWTEGAQRLYGWTREEAEGKSALELMNTRTELSMEEIVRVVCSRGEWQGELAQRRRDGSVIYVASHWTLHRDEEGKPASIIEVDNDISSVLAGERQRESLLKQLTETQARLEAIVQQMPLGVAIASAPSGELLLHNEEAVRLLRHPMYPSSSIEGYTAYGALHEDQSAYGPAEHPLALALSGEVVKNRQVLYRRGDGSLTHLRANAGPVRDVDGNVIAAVTVFEDISERKHAEEERERLLRELQRSNEDLSQFAHTVSHDLQEPLRTMRSYSDLLLRRYSGALDENGAEFIRFIAGGAERMDELVQALLQYARSGGAQLSLQEICIGEIVSAAIGNLEPLIEGAQATVECQELPAVRVDSVQMTQVFQNLIGNALKYRRRDVPPAIRIWAERGRERWVFAVADNGLGIAPAQWQRVFAPLKRLHGAGIPGSGMGLAICRKIVQRHGGEIWVESEPGAGSVFRFSIPD